MTELFRGNAAPLDQEGIEDVTEQMKIGVAELWAVLSVETRGCGFLTDRRPAILFERHVFSRETNHRYDASHPDISNQHIGGYGADGTHQYERIHSALTLDRRAALRSTSWGIGQLMGFNAEIAGYADVEAMVTSMTVSENRQLLGMAGEITHNRLEGSLRSHDWPSFARGYNGSGYARNSYDTRLSAAYQKYAHGPLPDLVVRTAQVYLMFLGYHPGPIDGIIGRRTRSALNEFQVQKGFPITNEIDKAQVAYLQQEVAQLES